MALTPSPERRKWLNPARHLPRLLSSSARVHGIGDPAIVQPADLGGLLNGSLERDSPRIQCDTGHDTTTDPQAADRGAERHALRTRPE
jgi:hypothetical protein